MRPRLPALRRPSAGPAHEKTFDVPPGICYNNQAHPTGLLRPAGNIWSITQEVEEVALERA